MSANLNHLRPSPSTPPPPGIRMISEFLGGDPHVAAEVHARIRSVFETHGLRAFEMPKRATCYHEAGHAVIYAAHGFRVLSVRVKRVPRAVLQGHPGEYWSGETHADIGAFVIDGDSSPDFTAMHMRFQLAGVVAETEFAMDDWRVGSSIDEVVAAQAMASNIALKTGHDPRDVIEHVSTEVELLLRANAAAVHSIAKALGREHHIRGQKLDALLSGVRPHSGEGS